jgi:hypothetical protein
MDEADCMSSGRLLSHNVFTFNQLYFSECEMPRILNLLKSSTMNNANNPYRRNAVYIASSIAAILLTSAILFVIPPYGQMPFAYQAIFAWLALALWSYSDGVFGRFNITLALFEGAAVLRISIEMLYFALSVDG